MILLVNETLPQRGRDVCCSEIDTTDLAGSTDKGQLWRAASSLANAIKLS